MKNVPVFGTCDGVFGAGTSRAVLPALLVAPDASGVECWGVEFDDLAIAAGGGLPPVAHGEFGRLAGLVVHDVVAVAGAAAKDGDDREVVLG